MRATASPPPPPPPPPTTTTTTNENDNEKLVSNVVFCQSTNHIYLNFVFFVQGIHHQLYSV